MKKYRVYGLVVGEQAGHFPSAFLGGGPFKGVTDRSRLPFGYDPEIRWSDGSVGPGVRRPIPVWYIEGADRKILIDTGFDDD